MVIQGNSITGVTQLDDGQWHLVALVLPYSGNTTADIEFYIDGLPEAHSSQVYAVNTGCDMDVKIGKALNTGAWRGWMDDVRIYDRALSAAEVQQLYYEW